VTCVVSDKETSHGRAYQVSLGLDVHNDSISVAAAELGRAPARLIGKVPHDLNKLLKVLNKIGTAEQLYIVYEAGPTGFGLQRALTQRGYVCEIIPLHRFRDVRGIASRPMGVTA
jgi:hypothetical protein